MQLSATWLLLLALAHAPYGATGLDLRDIAAQLVGSPASPPPPPLANSGDAERQPAEVRMSTLRAAPSSREMRCGEKLPAYSVATTRGIEIFAKSKWVQRRGAENQWSYTVEFRNVGKDTVQLLTRHWVFVDSDGKVSEVMGPGVIGKTPTLVPGQKYEYTSGTMFGTDTGTCHGSFQFVMAGSANAYGTDMRPREFSARVGRMSLSLDGKPTVGSPCGVGSFDLPTTSVWSTRRVIAGATTHYVEDTHTAQRQANGKAVDLLPDDDVHFFVVDVQINNVRARPVRLLRRHLRFVTEGAADRVDEGDGVRWPKPTDVHNPIIASGRAYRFKVVHGVPAAAGLVHGYFEFTEVAPGVGGGGMQDVGAPWKVRLDVTALERHNKPLSMDLVNQLHTQNPLEPAEQHHGVEL